MRLWAPSAELNLLRYLWSPCYRTRHSSQPLRIDGMIYCQSSMYTATTVHSDQPL